MSKDDFIYDEYGVDTSAIKERERKKRQARAKQEEEQEKLSVWKRFLNFFRHGRTHVAMGVILLMLGVYFLVTFLSFVLFSGGNDQGKVNNSTIIENADPANISRAVDNLGGSIGAATAQFFIADGVGLAAFIIVIWCFTLGMRLIRRKRVQFYTYSVISVYSILTFSMLLGALTYNSHFAFFRFGGNLGHYANQWLMGLLGIYGMIAVNLILLILWILVCYNTIMVVYKKMKSFNAQRKHMKEEDEAARTDRNHHDDSGFKGDDQSSTNNNRKSKRSLVSKLVDNNDNENSEKK
ncbi:MAG: DNA translocase FtsK 4TM domain-containing protein, partial [Muribaculaceae bacterium]|nr:DNA translocase FtsK 4TM domain-containing protein [Muribaculaceae bacterium]